MEIGTEQEVIEVEPIDVPEQAPSREPSQPSREPEKVPG